MLRDRPCGNAGVEGGLELNKILFSSDLILPMVEKDLKLPCARRFFKKVAEVLY